MTEPFVGEIRILPYTFAPRAWAFCDGQLLAVSQNDALFSLLGTIYGGDGINTFGLPDLRGRMPMHQGTSPGLSPRPLGQKLGEETVTLTTPNLPAHRHTHSASTGGSASPTPGEYYLPTLTYNYYASSASNGTGSLASGAIGLTGGGNSHSNMPPFLVLHFCIALFGVYPSRS